MEIQQLEEQIRKFINTGRNKSVLFKDPAGWNQLCSSLDVIDDTQLAISSYSSLCNTGDIGAIYLVIYGILQALVMQQDAIKSINTVLGIQKKRPQPLDNIRIVRDRAAGHPTRQNQKQLSISSFINRFFLLPTKFEIITVYSDYKRENKVISIPKLIEIQEECLIEILKNVINELVRQEMKHKEKHRDKVLASFFSTSGYFCGKVIDSARDTEKKHLGITYLNLLENCINDFKSEFSERGEWDETMDVDYEEIIYPINELRRYFEGSYSSRFNSKDAYIFACFLSHKIQVFEKIAKEFDAKYESSY